MKSTASEIQKYLEGVTYPASKSDLTSRAEENGATQEVMDDLESLSEGEFSGPSDVMSRLSASEEGGM